MEEPYTTHNKIRPLKELILIVGGLKAEGKRIVTTNGCFDIIHAGHIAGFEWARSQGDVLIVGLNSDRSVRENKGPKRPIIGEEDRARVVAAFVAVDYVLIFDGKGTQEWVFALKPDVHVKGEGSQYAPAFEGERRVVEAGGGVMRLAPQVPGLSTSSIIEVILKRYRDGNEA